MKLTKSGTYDIIIKDGDFYIKKWTFDEAGDYKDDEFILATSDKEQIYNTLMSFLHE